MRDVCGEAQKRRVEAEAEEERKESKKRLADEKKVAEAQAAVERAQSFARCEERCSCEVVPCPWAGWKRCSVCGPKKGMCKVRACVAARKSLLLGYNPAVAVQE